MRRFKILLGISILILTFIALVLKGNDPLSDSGSKHTNSSEAPNNSWTEYENSRLYNSQQRELKIAVKAYFDKAIAAGDIVGVGVSIVRGDSIVVSDGFGKRNINLNKGVDGRTIFRLGSLSKGFAGILAADLEDEGKLDWDDKVCTYIPDFRLGDNTNTEKITLANILSHTSGAPYHSYTNLVEAGLPLTDIAKRFKDVKPISDPGLLYSYQNALFALSGEIVYKATGQEISTALDNRIFKPLEMCSATMDYETLGLAENVAMPHAKRRRSWKPKKLTNSYFNAIAAGGINASAIDMAKWMRFLLGYNPEVMSKAAIKEAFNPFIEIKGHSKYYQRWPGHQASYYGFGWRIHKFIEDDTNQQKTIWHHGGSVNGFRNEIAVYPEADLGICVLLNNNSKLARNVVPDLYKMVLEIYNEGKPEIALNSNPDIITHF